MSVINLTLPDGELSITGKQVTFIAPCSSADAEGVSIGGVKFALVDSCRQSLSGSEGHWVAGATLSIVLNCENSEAFVQSVTPTAHYVKTFNKEEVLGEDIKYYLGLEDEAIPEEALMAVFEKSERTSENFVCEIFRESGTWKAPIGIADKSARVIIVGGGGGGGGNAYNSTLYHGGGGAGGGLEIRDIVTDRKNHTIIVGAGGEAGIVYTSSNNLHPTDGGKGGSSSFDDIVAEGGEGGYCSDNGGMGGSSPYRGTGGGGGGRSPMIDTIPTSGKGGDGGMYGGGGGAGRVNNAVGGNGGMYGGGGGSNSSSSISSGGVYGGNGGNETSPAVDGIKSKRNFFATFDLRTNIDSPRSAKGGGILGGGGGHGGNGGKGNPSKASGCGGGGGFFSDGGDSNSSNTYTPGGGGGGFCSAGDKAKEESAGGGGGFFDIAGHGGRTAEPGQAGIVIITYYLIDKEWNQ